MLLYALVSGRVKATKCLSRRRYSWRAYWARDGGDNERERTLSIPFRAEMLKDGGDMGLAHWHTMERWKSPPESLSRGPSHFITLHPHGPGQQHHQWLSRSRALRLSL